MTLSESRIDWDGLSLFGSRGRGGPTFHSLTGWEGWEGRVALTDRDSAHGTFDSPVLGNARRVIVQGRCISPENRDAELAELGDVLVPSAPDAVPADLRITHAGRTLTVQARLLRFAPLPVSWGAGAFDWAAEWVCADPVRYEDPVSVRTGFPSTPGGLHFPLFTNRQRRVGVLSYGKRSTSGLVTLTNPGTAQMFPLFQVAGPVPQEGFDLVSVAGGQRIRFEDRVPEFSTLTIDTATGLATLDGQYDRSGRLTVREWDGFVIPRRGADVDVAFVPLGTMTSAELTAVSRPGRW